MYNNRFLLLVFNLVLMLIDILCLSLSFYLCLFLYSPSVRAPCVFVCLCLCVCVFVCMYVCVCLCVPACGRTEDLAFAAERLKPVKQSLSPIFLTRITTTAATATTATGNSSTTATSAPATTNATTGPTTTTTTTVKKHGKRKESGSVIVEGIDSLPTGHDGRPVLFVGNHQVTTTRRQQDYL